MKLAACFEKQKGKQTKKQEFAKDEESAMGQREHNVIKK